MKFITVALAQAKSTLLMEKFKGGEFSEVQTDSLN